MENFKNISNSEDYELYKIVSSENFSAYLIRSKATQEVIYSPHLAGIELQDKMKDVAKLYSLVASPFLHDYTAGELVEYVLLTGGLFYQLNEGFKKTHSFSLPQIFLGISRRLIPGKRGTFYAISTYENFESLGDKRVVLLGDTIATGTTLIKSLDILKRRDKKKEIEKVLIFSLASSSKILKILKKKSEEYCWETILFGSEHFLHLMPDGTDLRYFGPGAIAPEKSKIEGEKRLGKDLYRNMKCAVFDWGTRCKNPQKHYHEFLEFENKVRQRIRDPYSLRVLDKMRKNVEKNLRLYSLPISKSRKI